MSALNLGLTRSEMENRKGQNPARPLDLSSLPKDPITGIPAGFTGWADSGGRNKYYTNGMLIENPKNPDHYRYKWFQDNRPIAPNNWNYHPELKKLKRRYDDGKMSSYELDKEIDKITEKWEMDKRKWSNDRKTYDVPWYVDLRNLWGML